MICWLHLSSSSSSSFFWEKVFSFHRNLLNDDNAKIFIPKTFLPPLDSTKNKMRFFCFIYVSQALSFSSSLPIPPTPYIHFTKYSRKKFRWKLYNWSFVLRCLLKSLIRKFIKKLLCLPQASFNNFLINFYLKNFLLRKIIASSSPLLRVRWICNSLVIVIDVKSTWGDIFDWLQDSLHPFHKS